MKTRAGHRKTHWHEVKREYLEQVSVKTGINIELQGRRSSRRARTPDGWVAITTSSERSNGGGGGTGRWFLGINGRDIDDPTFLGVVLLCEEGHKNLDFGFPKAWVSDVAGKLHRDDREELKFEIRREGARYFLQVPGADDLDITSALGDLSWLRKGGTASARATTPPPPGSPEPVELAFFASVRDGVIVPLDPPALAEGDLILVRVTPAPAVPGNATLRRILAAGGLESLPPDFAENHDAYAHAHGAKAR